MMGWISIFIGGGLGSLCRYGIGQFYPNHSALGTLVANILACLLLGFLVGWQMKKGLDNNMRLLFITGFCGGFSTFSTFSSDAFNMMQDGSWVLSISYILASVVLCILSIALGVFISRLF